MTGPKKNVVSLCWDLQTHSSVKKEQGDTAGDSCQRKTGKYFAFSSSSNHQGSNIGLNGLKTS